MPPINRRHLLGGAALSLAGTALPVHAANTKSHTPESLRHLLSNETYRLRDEFRAGRLNLLNLAEFYKDILNIRGISLNDIYFKSWDEAYLQQILLSFKMDYRAVTCLVMEGNLAAPDAAERRMQIDTNMKKLKAAAVLGAPVVRMNLGHVGPGEDDRKEGVDRCIAAFKKMLPLAQDLGIRIAIENHGGVSGSIEGILAVIHGTDPKWVGSLLDFGNPPVGHNPELFSRLVPYAYHTHAKLSRFKPDGEAENSDYGTLLALLKKADYQGAVSVEWEGEGEAIEGIKRTRDLIHKHWPELPT